MASPHAAGALAVVRELHPEWTVEELKALLMNTAVPRGLARPEWLARRL